MGRTLEFESMSPSVNDPAVPVTELNRTARGSSPCIATVTVLSYRRLLRLRAFVLALGSLLLTAATGQAQEPEPVAETAGDTPRSTLTRFFELSRRGDYAEAAKFLELPVDMEPERAPELAKRLKLVLDHYVWFDMSKISAAPTGTPNDGLSPRVDEIARLPLQDSLTAPVWLVRRSGPDTRWQFSRVTVQRVDGWYSDLANRFWLDLMPEPLLRMGPENLLWGQWTALPLFLLLVWTLGVSLSRGIRKALRPFVKRASNLWDEALLGRTASPLTSLFTVFAAYLLLPMLGLYPPALDFANRALRALLFATFFWGLARSVDIAGQLLGQSRWGHGAPATRAMLLFASRIGKSMVAAFALVTLFSELGYPVTSLIAGLGVGGIAVALSAQKSLENLIGAFAIAVDQPFREGDFVRVDNMVGTVELIGMRSTRIRTLDRTLVSIPNGKLADMRIETFAARDRVRMFFAFGLTYATSESQLRTVLERFDELLRNHRKLWPEGRSVRFKELGESGLTIEVACWFATADWDEFTIIRQEVLLALMKIVEDSGASFALPARALSFDTGKAANDASQSGPAFALTAQRGSGT
jgi:MscS family membrane protein